MASDNLNIKQYYSGLGISNGLSNTLPLQTVSTTTKKTPQWQKENMDALESIGVSQLAENIHFEDFYKMLRGNLVYSDYGIDDLSLLDRIRNLGDDVQIPTFVKHYDIIGIMVRQIVGEWLKQKDNFKVDSTGDEISENDYLREQTRKTNESSLKAFENEIQLGLVRLGISPMLTEPDFNSEEEKQQYMQMLEQERAKIVSPEMIQADLSKNFKTKAAEWAENTLEQDQKAKYLDLLDKTEMEDKLLTGRYFRHYHVGYDYYKPERWSPSETFFSKDVNAQFPQDGEYVGRVFELSVSDILTRYGHLMTGLEIRNLQSRFARSEGGDTRRKGINEKVFGSTEILPFENYDEYTLGLEVQDAWGTPMGKTNVFNAQGEEETIPTWLSPLENGGYYINNYSQHRRDDFIVRNDLIQVTEGYWRSWQKMWYVNYTTESGQPDTEIVTDEILPGFVKEHDLSKSSVKSLKFLNHEDLKENTMYEFWIPQIWKGIKVNAGNSGMKEDLYIGVEPLEYQIKGDSNIFDLKLPVAGYIGDSLAQRVRPYQIGYNVCLNQIFNLLEKEIGMFFLFDINFLPSEYKDHGTIEDSLEKLRDLAKDIGLVPLDTTKQNMAGANQSMNTFMVQDISFDKQINSRIQLSEYYFRKALEQVGITDQRRGQATTYETATGVQQGVQASYDQTSDIFTEMSVSRKKSMELHLSIAQYCQKNYIDQDFIFTASDGSKSYMNLTDPDFPLRRLGLIPTDDPKGRRNLEMVKQKLFELNTMGSDLLAYADAANSDTMLELIAVGKKARKDAQEQEEAKRQHEQTMLDKNLQAQAQEKQIERKFKASEAEKDRETDIESERISALGRASDKKSDESGFDKINEATRDALNNNFREKELNIKEEIKDSKIEIEKQKLDRFDEELKIRLKELDLKKKISEDNKFIALINKN